jgi:hypothetical protein
VSYRDWLFGNDPRGFSIPSNGKKIQDNYTNYIGQIDFPLFGSQLRKYPKLNGRSFSFSFGNSHFFTPELKLGFIFAQNFSSKYKSKFTEIEKITISDEGYFEESEIGTVERGGGETRGVEEYKYSTLLSIGGEIGDHSELGYTFIDINDFESSSTEYDYEKYRKGGDDLFPGDQPGLPPVELQAGLQNYRDMTSKPTQNEFTLNMLNGKHTLNNTFFGTDLEWNIARVDTNQKEADIRNIFDYFRDEGQFVQIAKLPPVSRFNRETSQNTDIYNVKFSNSLDLSDDIIYSFNLGASGIKSERNFTQLEALVSPIGHVPSRSNYLALPAPSNLGDTTNRNFYFFDEISETQSFVEDRFANRESTLETNIDNNNNNISASNSAIIKHQLDIFDYLDSIDTAVSEWNYFAGFPGVYTNAYLNPSDLKVYDNSEFTGVGILHDIFLLDNPTFADSTLDGIFNEINQASDLLELERDDLAEEENNIIEYQANADQYALERSLIDSEMAQMRQFYSDLATLDSFVDLPNYSFNYTVGEDSSPYYLLNTPIGYGFYTTSFRADDYSTSADFLYEATGVSETDSYFFNNSFKFNQFLGNKILTISTGIRVEESKLSYKISDKRPEVEGVIQPEPISGIVTGFKPYVIDNRPIDQTDEYYYLTTSLEPEDRQFKIFLSTSSTSAKPTFREIAPFPVFNITNKSVELGNPGLMLTDALRINDPDVSDYYILTEQFAGLKYADVFSNDIRIDYYLGDDGLLSLGFFHKVVEGPIEKILARTIRGVDINTFLNNNNDADIKGIEFEFKKSFGDLSFGGNYSKIDAEVERSKYEKDAITNELSNKIFNSLIDPDAFTTGKASKRSLYNQPNYMGNFFISYYFERLGLTCSFSKNWVGEQLNRVGSVTSDGGSPDLFWDSYHSSNLVLDYQINDNWNIKLTVKDLDSSPRRMIYGENFVKQLSNQQVYQEEEEDYSSSNALGHVMSYSRKSSFPEPSFSLSISGKF